MRKTTHSSVDSRLKAKLELSKRQTIKTKQIVCLISIVKNESKIIERMLSSALEVLDIECCSIVDTGSDDNTKDLISKWCTKHKISFVIHNEPFVNFSYNRTDSFRRAKLSFPDAQIGVLSDADFVWKGGPLNRNLLFKDDFSVEQRHGTSLAFSNIRLIKMSHDWTCIGVTHEYWDVPGTSLSSGMLKKVWIEDVSDGGCKTDKYERDIKLLETALEVGVFEPKYLESRYLFYLGESYKNSCRYKDSINTHVRKLSLKDDFLEYNYYSMYSISVCYTKLAEQQDFEDNYILALEWTKKAFELLPERAEAIYDMVKFCRIHRKYEDAMKWIKIGSAIKYPLYLHLFVRPDCYEYLFDYELSIVASYIGALSEGEKAMERLLTDPKIPEIYRKYAEENAHFYL